MGLQIGSLYVRRSIFIQAAPARVWAEFASFDRLASWLSQGHVLHRLEPEQGGTADLSVTIDGDERHFGGEVLCVEPERELSLQSQWAQPHAWPTPTFWTFRLSALYEGTLVELFHHGFERLGDAAADNLQSYEQGWGLQHLATLRDIVERGA